MLFAIFCITIAAIAVLVGANVLFRMGWFLPWLRGTAGLALVGSGALLALAAFDLFSYKHLLEDSPILTISFERKDEQLFAVTLLDIEEGTENSFDVAGEQWQVDARVIRWQGIMQALGAKPVYRLDRLSGRYYSLEDERRNPRSVHQLASSQFGLDTWKWVQENGRYVPLVDAMYGSATYLPMENGAIFEISLSASGLMSKPLNDIAKQAIQRWQ